MQKITKVRVRETVPDTVFDKADEVILVDFPPDELLKRLAEGKVYVQDTASRAVEHFFKPQNLTALRELALRRAAERIDADLIERMQAQAIEGPWAAGERILACIGLAHRISPTVVRAAKRLADLMDAPWIAVTVERPGATFRGTRLGNASTKIFLALYMQNILGYSPLETGVRFLPSTLVIMVAGPVSGRLADRIGPRIPLVIGLLFVTVSLAWQSRIEVDTSFAFLVTPFILLGLGMGFTMSPMSTAAMNAVDRSKAGVASGP